MNKILLLLILITSLSSCFNQDINIRLMNDSESNFQNITVISGFEEVEFEDLGPGEISEYQSFKMAYRYAFVRASVDGVTCTLQPIDYVGETPLDGGNYTYQLTRYPKKDSCININSMLIID